uniref:phenylalanine--tRNA ligase n=1 Tax=Rhizochromulina marina TaxID=1034831 RepID=A0A514CQ19_9STRA|nr:Phenylalanine--tRNA ligase beta subunit [Rhizochromulina marina]QDH81901.1 Phenylalanine--tRNA ligase beta subunit [Rhizochromulina marina]
MYISINWLNNLLATKISTKNVKNPEKLLSFYGLNPDNLTLSGFEVENIEIKKINGESDIRMEIDITPNRRDVNSMVGICQEIMTLSNISLAYSSIFKNKINFPQNGQLHKNLDYKKDNYLLFSAQIQNIKITESPNWLKKRLRSHNFEPKNYILDIANYVRLEWGQPIHIYDLETLEGKGGKLNISLEKAEPGSIILDSYNQCLSVNNNTYLIKTNEKILSIAGVVENHEVTVKPTTRAILIECPIYPRKIFKATNQSLNYQTENSKLFEKGINLDNSYFAFQRMLRLISLQNKEAYYDVQIIGNPKIRARRRIPLKLQSIKNVLGEKTNNQPINSEEVVKCLRRLKFDFSEHEETNGSEFCITIPGNRLFDIEEETDVIEEIGRIYSFNHFKSRLPPTYKIGNQTNEENLIQRVKSYLINHGFYELMHYSFNNEDTLNLNQKTSYSLLNPASIGKELQLNLSLNLLNAIRYNQKQQNNIHRGFEIARVFQKHQNREVTFLSGFISNESYKNHWGNQEEILNWHEAKSFVIELLQFLTQKKLCVKQISRPKNYLFHTGRSAGIFVENQKIGIFTQIHPAQAKSDIIPSNTYIFEINATILSQMNSNTLQFKHKAYSLYPKISKDLSIIVPSSMTVEKCSTILYSLVNKTSNFTKSVKLKDIYKFKKDATEYKTLTYSLILQSNTRTLVHEEIEVWLEQLTNELKKTLSC